MLIDQTSLSLAWAKAFLAAREARGHQLSPLMVSFTGFEGDGPVEDEQIRSAVDEALEGSGFQSVQTVANTIFPQVLWRRAKGDRAAFYQSYRESLPDYVALDPQKNKRGLYFGRLTAYGLDHRTGEPLGNYPAGSLPEDGNQIEVIISKCVSGVQRMKLQASVFDPSRDHVNDARIGFPCLQHITFNPCFDAGTISMNAFYATQQLFMKGYGNFLGLARLACFVAEESGLVVDRLSCFIGIEKMETGKGPAKGFGESLASACKQSLGRAGVLAGGA